MPAPRLRGFVSSLSWRHLILLLGLLIAAEEVRSSLAIYKTYETMAPMHTVGEMGEFFSFAQRSFIRQTFGGETVTDIDPELAERGLLAVFHNDNKRRAGQLLIGDPVHLFEYMNQLDRRGELIQANDGRLVMINPPSEMSTNAKLYVRNFPGYVEDAGPRPMPHGIDRGMRPPPVMGVEFVPRSTERMVEQARQKRNIGFVGALLIALLSVAVYIAAGHFERLQKELFRKRLLASLGEMSAVISHELRNPLAAAMGQAELLEAYLEEGRAQDKARRISHELGRLEELANDLLAFVNSGRIALEEVDLKPTLEVILRALHNERLHVHYAHDLPEQLVCDPAMLGRAVDNIVDNALKISEDTGGRVFFTVFRDDESVYFQVEDEGPGLPEGVDVFKPFVTTREKGTGLGLAITSEIARAHRGTITAENRPSGGAKFLITIPIDLAPSSGKS